MKTFSTRRRARPLPMRLRLRLVWIRVQGLKHSSSFGPTLLLLCLVVASGVLGYAIALHQQRPAPATLSAGGMPAMAAATISSKPVNDVTAQSQWLFARELGRLQSEIITLRVLFLRLAKLAQLEGGEFDLDMDFSPLQRHSSEAVERDEEGQSGQDPVLQNGAETSLVWPGYRPVSAADMDLAALEASLPLVKQNLVHMSEQAARLATIFRKRRLAHDFRVSGRPVADMQVSSPFGYRASPFTGRRLLHKGLDLSGERGSRIMALADGIVTYSGKNGSYGNLVELEHSNGYRTRYAHNDSVLVPLGARVSKGQAIATMGSTGRSTGIHVHVEVRREGQALDPQLYIR